MTKLLFSCQYREQEELVFSNRSQCAKMISNTKLIFQHFFLEQLTVNLSVCIFCLCIPVGQRNSFCEHSTFGGCFLIMGMPGHFMKEKILHVVVVPFLTFFPHFSQLNGAFLVKNIEYFFPFPLISLRLLPIEYNVDVHITFNELKFC